MPRSVPAEVDARQRVELLVVWSVEVAQFLEHLTINGRVNSTLGLAETPDRLRRRPQTRKALRRVEVEMAASDERSESEEPLDVGELSGRVSDQSLTVDEVELTAWKHVEPRSDVTCVQTDVDGRPRRVHQRLIGVDERTTLERRSSTSARTTSRLCLGEVRLCLGEVGQRPRDWVTPRLCLGEVGQSRLCLGEVRQRPRDWVTDDHQQAHVVRHVVDALCRSTRHKVAGSLFHGQLTTGRHWHSRPDARTHTVGNNSSLLPTIGE